MNEMLGNQYFMARKYSEALSVYEECVQQDKSNNLIMKKMVICYTQVGKIQKAAELLYKIIQNNLDLILFTDPLKEDCPCDELAFNLETKYDKTLKSFDYLLALGVLWLYCDLNKSIEYFTEALQLKPDNKLINSILVILTKRKKQDSKQFDHHSSWQN